MQYDPNDTFALDITREDLDKKMLNVLSNYGIKTVNKLIKVLERDKKRMFEFAAIMKVDG